jgi:ABC-type glycerol-3-phosphate transport system substrate-binding protein
VTKPMWESRFRMSRRTFFASAGVGGAAIATAGFPMPALAKKVKITYWSPLDPKANNARSKGEAAMIALFTQRHPDIEVEVQPVPWQVMGQQIIQSVMSGSGPDAAQLSTTNLPDQVGTGSAAPLNDYVGKNWSQVEKDDFVLPLANTTYDGKIMALYWSSLLNNEFWYLGDEVEGEIPDDWNKLPVFLKPQQEKRGKHGFLTGLSQQGNAIEFTDWLIPALWACGAEYVTATGDAGFLSDAAVEPFEWLLSMVKTHKVTPDNIISISRDNLLDAMKGRKALSTFLTSNIVSAARSVLGDNLVLGRQPGPKGHCAAFASGKFIMMTSTCKEREATGLFIESMVSPESQLLNAKIAKEIPSRKSTIKDGWFETHEAADLKFALNYMADSPHIFKYPMKTDYLQTRLALAAQQMMTGKPIKETLKQVAREWDAVRKA